MARSSCHCYMTHGHQPESPAGGSDHCFWHILLIGSEVNRTRLGNCCCNDETLALNLKCLLIQRLSYCVHPLEQHISACLTSWPFPIWADRKKAIQFQRDRGCENPPGTRTGWKRSTCTGYRRICVRRNEQDGAAVLMQRSTQGTVWFGYCTIQTMHETLGSLILGENKTPSSVSPLFSSWRTNQGQNIVCN